MLNSLNIIKERLKMIFLTKELHERIGTDKEYQGSKMEQP